MEKSKTLFILGAGASHYEYGFPLGSELIMDIIRLCDQRGHHEFRHRLFSSHFKSIDEFLTHNADLRMQGKELITEVILEYERKYFNRRQDHRLLDGFYHFLFRTIAGEFENYQVITFNYDRLLENTFYDCFKDLKTPTENIWAEIQKLKIHRPFGKLFSLPGEGVQGPDGKLLREMPFASYLFGSYADMKRSGAFDDLTRMKLVYEGEQQPECIEMINQSETIFFVGLSYNHINMQVLGFRSAVGEQNAFSLGERRFFAGSAHGLGTTERSAIKSRYSLQSLIPSDWKDFFSNHYSVQNPRWDQDKILRSGYIRSS